MGKFARFDSGDGSFAAYATADLGSNQSEVWIEFLMRSDAAAQLAQCQSAYLDPDTMIPPPVGEIVGLAIPGSDAVSWVLAEIHYSDGVALDTYADGVLVSSFGSGFTGSVRYVSLPFLGFGPCGIADIDNVKIGTTRHGTDLFADDFEDGTFDAWAAVEGDATIIDESETGDRFFDSPDWRFVLTDLNLVVLTLLDRLATNRTVTVVLNGPRIHEGQVLSDNPKVNIPWTDGYAYLSEGDRFCFGLRRDGIFPDFWTPRFAGIVDLVDTSAAGDNATTRYTARDPRQMMFKRPVRDAAGALPGDTPLTFTGETGRDILVQLLANSETYDGPTYIDYENGPELNQTDVIPVITFQQGTTVGEAWGELEATGTMDTALLPLFDEPAVGSNDPVWIVQLETYPQAGEFKPDVIMAWDKPGRTLTGIQNMRDGSGRINSMRAHYGQGGPAATTIDDPASQTRFGTYFGEQFFPGQTSEAAVELMAEKVVEAQAMGKRVVVAYPSPQRAKQPFVDYLPGDRVPVAASRALLEELDTEQRVLAIPISIDDQGTETVTGLLFTDEGWVGS